MQKHPKGKQTAKEQCRLLTGNGEGTEKTSRHKIPPSGFFTIDNLNRTVKRNRYTDHCRYVIIQRYGKRREKCSKADEHHAEHSSPIGCSEAVDQSGQQKPTQNKRQKINDN